LLPTTAHPFAHRRGQLLELFTAELIVVVGVEGIEQAFGIRRIHLLESATGGTPWITRATLVVTATEAALSGSPRLRAGVLQGSEAVAITLLATRTAPTIAAIVRRSATAISLGALGAPTIRLGTCATTLTHLTHRLGEFRELLATELAVFVFVEPVEQLHRIGRTLGTLGSPLAPAAFATCLTALVATFGAGFGLFFLVKFSVSIGVEFFDDTLPSFGLTGSFGLAGFFVGCVLGSCRRWQEQGCRDKGQNGGEVSHGYSSWRGGGEKLCLY